MISSSEIRTAEQVEARMGELGHEIEWDMAGFLQNHPRATCARCGSAVILMPGHAYGSGLEPCSVKP